MNVPHYTLRKEITTIILYSLEFNLLYNLLGKAPLKTKLQVQQTVGVLQHEELEHRA